MHTRGFLKIVFRNKRLLIEIAYIEIPLEQLLTTEKE